MCTHHTADICLYLVYTVGCFSLCAHITRPISFELCVRQQNCLVSHWTHWTTFQVRIIPLSTSTCMRDALAHASRTPRIPRVMVHACCMSSYCAYTIYYIMSSVKDLFLQCNCKRCFKMKLNGLCKKKHSYIPA